MGLHYETVKEYCLRNGLKKGDWLWSATWNSGYAAAKRITGYGESCVVMRRPGAMEHIEYEAPMDLRMATIEEIQAEKAK